MISVTTDLLDANVYFRTTVQVCQNFAGDPSPPPRGYKRRTARIMINRPKKYDTTIRDDCILRKGIAIQAGRGGTTIMSSISWECLARMARVRDAGPVRPGEIIARVCVIVESRALARQRQHYTPTPGIVTVEICIRNDTSYSAYYQGG